MKALTFQGIKNLSIETVDDPVLSDARDVVVKVVRTAICGSDLHPYLGRETGLDVGTVMGHEFAGQVVAVGCEVTSLRLDDYVICPFTTNCGTCYYCQIGLTARCVHGQLFGWRENGLGLHGAQAEYVRVPLADSTLINYDATISAETALLAGDVLSTGMYCAERAEVHAEGIYAIIGCGPIGLMTIVACLDMGVRNIFAFDSVPERLARATRYGVTAVNYQSEDAVQFISDATEGRGVDAVMEAVGSQNAGRLAFDLVRPGGTISTVGVHTDSHLDFSPIEAYAKNITYRVGRCPARHYMPRALNVISRDEYDFPSYISHRVRLTDAVDAYRMFEAKQDGCVKVILEP